MVVAELPPLLYGKDKFTFTRGFKGINAKQRLKTPNK